MTLSFRDAYTNAETLTVFWCPTVFCDPTDIRSSTSTLVEAITEPCLDPQNVDGIVTRVARAEVTGYFDAFDELASKKQLYEAVIDSTARSVVRTGVELLLGRELSSPFVDLAPSAKYKEIVSRLGAPVACTPSFGFYFQAQNIADPSQSNSPFDESVGALRDVGLNLEFQIEATYDSLPPIEGVFLPACHDFIDVCRQDRLLIDLGREGTWLIGPPHIEPERLQTAGEWTLHARSAVDDYSLARFIRNRVQHHLALQRDGHEDAFIGNVAGRWIEQARLRGATSMGATVMLATDDAVAVRIRVCGFSHWLFEALFPIVVNRLQRGDVALHDAMPEPPDPILLQTEETTSKSATFVVYQSEPDSNKCICGSGYPAHDSVAAVVSLRNRAKGWIEQQYPVRRDSGALEWRTLSAPRTYFEQNPEAAWGPEADALTTRSAQDGANLHWQRLMNTFFEAAPLIAEAGTRQRLSLREACRTCENVCCRTGSPMVSSQERDWIVRSSGCNDYFTAIPGASDFFWIGVNRDGTARQMNDKGAATVDPCPYFDEISGDCLIQEWKPLDCAVYPARLRKVGDTFDVVFTTKCPATAEGLSEEFKVIAQTEAPHILGDNRDASKLAEYRRVGGSWTIKDEE